MTVGATYWQNDSLESFSSRGPTNDGRTKPDVTAPDGVSTYTYGSGNFYGTSASSPHVAGSAALLLSAGPLCTADDLQNLLENTAKDLGASGKDNLYGSGRINVWNAYNYMRPTANFTYTPENPSTQDVIQFTDTSIDGDGTIVNWTWDFGDGTNSTTQHPTHQYADDGTYTVNLTVTDDDGATNDTAKQIHVSNVGPTADFTWSPLDPTTDDTIQFTDNSTDSDGYILSWLWDFGDGNTSTTQHPTHQYDNGGAYTISLTVTDDDGVTDNISHQIVVNVIPVASFSYNPPNPYTSDIISFTDQSIDSYGPITSWFWDFGDGVTSTDQNSTHQYSDNGTYTVTLNVTDEYGATNETSQQIVVSNVGPIADFSWSPTEPTTDDTIQFTDNSTDGDGTIVSWSWAFGDGTNSTTQHPTHQFADNGTYTVTLNVTDDDGATNETHVEITVANVPPIVNFTYTPHIPTINDIVQFNDTSIDLDGTIVNWTWDFGDGNTSASRNTTHQYSDNLTYNVTLTVKDNDGDTSSLTKQIITRIIYTNMTQDGNETTINLQNEADTIIVINTTNSTTVNVSKYSGNPTGENISGNITAVGKYVGIDVENESTIVWPVNITIYYTQNDLNNYNINESQLIGIYLWNDTTGEWQLYNDTGVNTTYNQSGYEGYCWVNAWHLTPLTLGGDNEPPSKVTGLTVADAKDGKLDLSWSPASDNVGVGHYKIYRDGGFLISKTTMSYRDTGLTNGQSYSYQVSAVDIAGNEGEKSDSKSGTPTSSGGGNGGGGGEPPGGPPVIPMSNQPPIANISAGEPYYGFVGEEITFDGSLSHDSDGEVVSWYWDFGDGTNGTGEIITHIYSSLGAYTVILTVVDDQGAEDTSKTTAVISQPNRVPSAPDVDGPQEGTRNTEYTYTAVSTDRDNDTIQYHFDWGDGTTNTTEFLPNGTATTQTHIWTAAGRYTISVQAYDNQKPSGTTGYTVLIDAHMIEGIGYITDDDADGTYDTFQGENVVTELGQEGGRYLIDTNGDGDWDYTYDLVGGLATYEKEEEIEIPWAMIAGIVIAIAIVVYLYKKIRK